jgi:hypothetical protein
MFSLLVWCCLPPIRPDELPVAETVDLSWQVFLATSFLTSGDSWCNGRAEKKAQEEKVWIFRRVGKALVESFQDRCDIS